MTFEERMDAITMNLELMGHRVEDNRREAEARRRDWEERQKAVALEMADLRERTDVLLKATTQMLAVADAHDRRIARLEHISA